MSAGDKWFYLLPNTMSTLEDPIKNFKTSPKELRARDKKNKKMFAVTWVNFDYGEVFWIRSKDKPKENSCWCCDTRNDDWYSLEDVELLRFTGLYDKNKQKIREGDIIKFRWEQEYGVIEFVEWRFSYNLTWWADTATSRNMYLQERIDDKTGNLEREVFWNIFENSSLLQ